MTRTHSKTPLLIASLLGLLALSAGCLEGGSVRTGNYYPPNPPGTPVDIFYNGDDPGIPFEEVGHVFGQGDGMDATQWDVERVLAREARLLGADAVLVTETWMEVRESWDEYGPTSYEELHARGIAIRYLP